MWQLLQMMDKIFSKVKFLRSEVAMQGSANVVKLLRSYKNKPQPKQVEACFIVLCKYFLVVDKQRRKFGNIFRIPLHFLGFVAR